MTALQRRLANAAGARGERSGGHELVLNANLVSYRWGQIRT